VTKLFKKISAIYEQVCGGSTADKKIDSKVWTNYFSELYKYSNSTEYLSHVETCFQRKAESDDFVVFSNIFDFVSHFILDSKSSQMKASEEQPQIPNVYSSDNAGLGKLRYIAGRCVAKCKYHYMEMGRNNMYKPKKQSVVTASFLKVKILDHFTATYSELLDLEGDLKTFRSVDEGDIAKLKKIPVENTLHVKINCPVMLVKNLSQNLINGLQGVVQEIDTEMNTITVKFPDLVTEIKRETFTVYSSVENKVVASRRQIPLVLSYGITIHKAQGLTMDRVEVDCSNIFKAG
jgi:hypothetical protein